MTSTPEPTSSGRRMAAPAEARTGRTALVLAVVVPLLTLGAAALAVDESAPTPGGSPPTETGLTSLQVVCPESPAGTLGVASARADGDVVLRLGAKRGKVTLTQDATTVVSDRDPATVVDGRGDMAPGLVATRSDARDTAAVACQPPQPDYWFTGVGASSVHSSSLQLVNPDSGPAIADIEVYGHDGLLDVSALRGITVPGGTATTIDLAEAAPNRRELAVHVNVARGRLGAALLDRVSSRRTTTDWLPAQSAPATENVLLGLATGAGGRSLVVANPSPDQARVQLKIVGSSSTFTALGLEDLSVPPESVVSVDVGPALRKAGAKEEVGLQVSSSVPVTSSLRSSAGGDLTRTAPSAPIDTAALVVPAGRSTLVLAAPNASGSATVTAYDADGGVLVEKRLAPKRLTDVALDLPRATSLVVVSTERASLLGAVRVVTDRGVVTLPLTALVVNGLVPSVRPGAYLPGPSQPQSAS